MKKLDSLSAIILVTCFAITGCYENYVSPSKVISDPDRDFLVGIPDRDLPEGIRANDHWRYPYPQIIEREYIPPNDMFDHMKCLAWRIIWPSYDASADDDKIPTVFTTSNGGLNSFEYLNNIHFSNTYKTDFSLYYGNRVEASATMWENLDYVNSSEMENPVFAYCEFPLATVIDWVTERPTLFESYWPNGWQNDLDYEEGDIIQFYLNKADLYGGIRIVQMNPRIIEVYLAVSNE